MKAALPENESARLEALHAFNILDTSPEQGYDDITRLASIVADTPIALMTLVDAERQWVKSRIGLDVLETPRDVAFCAHAILEPEDLLIVRDTAADERFATNPLVTSAPHIRFYAGAPLVTSGGAALGTLCVIDHVPRLLKEEQKEALRALSRQVIAQLELRLAISKLERTAAARDRHDDQLVSQQRQLEALNAHLEIQSLTDDLTGVRNRRAFEQRLQEEVERSVRHGTPLSLTMLDVDHFKSYNDAFGHPAGDEVLRGVVRVLQAKCRKIDFLARYGGEEFAVIMPHTSKSSASMVAERLRTAVQRAPWDLRPITVSLGVSTMAPKGGDRSSFVAAADKALYEAKMSGRNRVSQA